MNKNVKVFDQVKIIMKVSGQWQGFKKYARLKILLQKARLWFMILLSPLSVLSMFLSGFMDSLSKYALFSAAAIFANFMAYTFIVDWELTKSVYERLRRIVARRDQPYESALFKRRCNPFWKLVKVFVACNSLFVLVYEILPYVYDAYLALFTDSEEPFMTPLPNQGYLVKDQKRNVYYYAVTVVTTLWCLSLTLVICGFEAIIFLFIAYTCTELKIIRMKIANWGKYGAASGIDIRQLIDEHREAIKLTDEMKDLFGGPMAAQNTVGSLSLTLYAYTIMVKLKTDIMLVLINAFVFVVVGEFLCLSCYMGEKLQDESLGIFDSLCQIPWDELSPQVRKELNMMLRQAQRPMLIHYKGRSPLTLTTLMGILNSSYSYFMVLKSMN